MATKRKYVRAFVVDRSKWLWISDQGDISAIGHVPNDHDMPTLTGFTSAPKETR